MKTAILKNLMAAIVIESAVVVMAFCGIAADAPRHNVIIFVADGLRAGSVTADIAPEMFHLENEGVRFTNSHSLFPTVTTANASAIATGHAFGDTGDFGNALYVGYPVPIVDHTDTLTPFLEADTVLSNLNAHFQGNYLGKESLLARARRCGFQTAAIGKLGPVLIQNLTENQPGPETIVIDDKTGTSNGVPLNAGVAALLGSTWLGTNAPDRSNGFTDLSDRRANSYSGNNEKPGTSAANTNQQKFFADALTRVVLPGFRMSGRPFVIVYWSRDPDGTQHNQGDGFGNIDVGINGPTSKAAIGNCDANLRQIREALTNLGLDKTTDIFVTADHGFDTISKRQVDASGKITKSYSATEPYYDSKGRQEVNSNSLPPGFLAIDLAKFLKTNLYDPDAFVPGGANYMPVDPANGRPTKSRVQRPKNGNGLIGGTGRVSTNDARVIVTANGGADFIYIPGDPSATNTGLVIDIVNFLTTQDYVSGVFVNDKYGDVAGALKFSHIGLMGWTKMPKPAIIVNFCSFTTDTNDPCQHGMIVADGTLQEGQGNHGGFDRAATYNFMAAAGPDFKAGYADPAPVGNADIAWTLAGILKLDLKRGGLTGRSIQEALAGKPDADTNAIKTPKPMESRSLNGVATVLDWQEYKGYRYFDAAGFPGRTLGLRP
jgi:arylsulfatase A-like enzyme